MFTWARRERVREETLGKEGWVKKERIKGGRKKNGRSSNPSSNVGYRGDGEGRGKKTIKKRERGEDESPPWKGPPSFRITRWERFREKKKKKR